MSADTIDRAAALAKLREKFPASSISKLPKVTCYNCTQANKQRRGSTCNEHSKAWCNVCRSTISTGHNHLDYVGHAEATDRLLDSDIEWTWEPLAFDTNGLPQFDSLGGLWIRLTVAGVTRLGYGSADGKQGPNAIKEVIGDAIRNAGMRFGMALDLWAKTDLHADEHDGSDSEPEPQRAARRENGKSDDEWSSAEPVKPGAVSKGQITNLVMEFKKARIESDEDRHRLAGQFLDRPIVSFNELTSDDVTRLKKALRGGWPHINPDVPSPAAVETGQVYAVVAQLITEAPGLEDLNQAGEDIAKEKERGNLTPGEIALLKQQWAKRKRELAQPVGSAA